MLEKWMHSHRDRALFFIRICLGIIFFAHGSQKLLGWYGGSGIQGTMTMFTQMGIWQPELTAWLVAGIEFFGGVALILGFFTREFAVLIILVMAGAIKTVHWKNGLFAQNGGFEYNLLIIMACLGLLFGGGGSLSVDRVLFPKERWRFVDPSSVRLEPPSDILD